ncbi:MAE_28990/MAE_18760 family HEPN-like nuclease [Streptomyces roseolilacinus]|uniref:RiboL-PSP-HEPN domain-containing protein n=1 Tax=Streptomyces roseolilacinus TaxID=66904 RepID=A0A918EJ09_9ACTN|nr:MAE_28990/MAE_18760 family HEPN-like nuclease [Streptomyces roseolilacinus]GGP87694.1 hypothetical protein GCM10010249_01230 [Streptomyces roseolilacinus]
MHGILKAALARFDEILSALEFDEKLQSLTETRESARNSEWRRLVYSGSIINLYGCLEQFVDDIIARYASLCATFFPEYTDLPENIQKAHDSQARQLLTRDSGGRLDRNDIDEMLRSLASCLDGAEDYTLSGIALSFHDRNLKGDMLSDLLRRVNVNFSDSIGKIDIKTLQDGLLSGLYKDVESILADLVSRRNEIAHGDYVDLASSDILTAICEVLKKLVTAIFDEIRKATFLHLSPALVGYVKQYYAKPKAHIIALEATEISVGDTVFGIEKGSSRLRAARIHTLKDEDIQAHCLAKDALQAEDGCIGMTLTPDVIFVGKVSSLSTEISALLADAEFLDSLAGETSDEHDSGRPQETANTT